jgi:hypothetical protein
LNGNQYFALQFETRSLPCFTELLYLFYVNKVKVVPENIYEMLTPVAKRIWSWEMEPVELTGYIYVLTLILLYSPFGGNILVTTLRLSLFFMHRLHDDGIPPPPPPSPPPWVVAPSYPPPPTVGGSVFQRDKERNFFVNKLTT